LKVFLQLRLRHQLLSELKWFWRKSLSHIMMIENIISKIDLNHDRDPGPSERFHRSWSIKIFILEYMKTIFNILSKMLYSEEFISSDTHLPLNPPHYP
jgi:hypothetical protein